MALCHSQVTLMLCTDINTTETTYPVSFNMYLVINKWVIAVNVSHFSGQYHRNHWTLDKGVLGYIGIVWPKERSPEVWSIPPVTPCIWEENIYMFLHLSRTGDMIWLRIGTGGELLWLSAPHKMLDFLTSWGPIIFCSRICCMEFSLV